MDIASVYKSYPFKLNLIWLMESDYKTLVYKVWKDPKYFSETGYQRRLVWKLKDIKQQTKLWSKEREYILVKRLTHLELQIKETFLTFMEDNTQVENELLFGNLERERNKILSYNEEKWRQWSIAIWISNGDHNTKFFHQFVIQRHIHKHILEIYDEDGLRHIGQVDIKEAATQYFRNFYKARGESYTTEKIEVTNLFQRMVQTEESNLIFELVLADEIKKVLDLFKRDKSPGPDDWTMEFFSTFFDLVSEDPIQMVEEYRSSGNIPGDPGGYWWPPTYSTWTPTIVSFSFSVSAQFTIFSSFSGRELPESF
jgi:hypothetical protein